MADFNLNTNLTSTPSLSVEMKTFYNKRMLDIAEPKLRHLQFGTAYPILKNGGKTIEFRKTSPLAKATTPIQEGVTPDGGVMNVSAITATIDQYGYYLSISDVLEYTAIDNTLVQAAKLLGSQMGRTLDTLCRDELVGGTNVIYAHKEDGSEVTSRSALDAGCKFTMDLLFDAVAELKAMNAEPLEGGDYVAIMHPYVINDLMKSEDWREAVKYQSADKIYDGEVGRIAGARIVDSSEAKIWRDETCPSGLAVHAVLVLADNAFAKTEVEGLGSEMIVHDKRQEGGPLEQRSTAGWKATHVTKRLSEEYMVRIECCSSRSGSVQAN
jgi:N4-gp56 family major capsid protein